ncbi:general substrate transporter [Propionibacterium sp. NM47_B9-13]|uniref:Major facilitator superfamily (MFS) profile domain-containing protein n=2 Tax=Cutibacterium modestum TaxID=2559073 RepID=A0AAD1KRL3_9ACTN|nr:hypothetical protein [Cutibacterium modestum]EFS74183.1 hypothetical protein HMPREF9621_01393 [Cutibacterium modestum HL037PA2]EFS92755.1 hypothetical protein HMPREF9607_00968 [Cutibacterium modestum HL044PA1]EFT15183.1 hypothetical protein HMPREF9622_01821 [Cutibacterium modestum HL037PA3]MCP2377963.1 general substrate transporter [Cutibacterium modestum 31N]TGY30262.1 general substrate transporter [Propionibacterium sp. NM47_B9-13]
MLVFLITLGSTLCFYTYSVNVLAIVKFTFIEEATTATTTDLIALVILMFLQPVEGLISDKIGHKSLLVFFGVSAIWCTWVLIIFLPKTTNPLDVFGLLLVGTSSPATPRSTLW